MDLTDETSKSLADLVDHLTRHIFSKWADRDGVKIQYHKTQPIVHFSFVTDDKVAVEVFYDVNKTSKEYIGNMVRGIEEHVVRVRQERHTNPIIINSGRAANA